MPIEEKTEEERVVTFRLRGELLSQFDELCGKEMRNATDMLRWLIAKEYERRANNQMALFDQAVAK